MKQIVIGDKPLMQISEEDILQVAVIQGCCACLDYWNYPTLTEYDNTMFRYSVLCSYKSTRKEDNRIFLQDSPLYRITHYMPIPSFDEILEANRDVLERIKEKGD